VYFSRRWGSVSREPSSSFSPWSVLLAITSSRGRIHCKSSPDLPFASFINLSEKHTPGRTLFGSASGVTVKSIMRQINLLRYGAGLVRDGEPVMAPMLYVQLKAATKKVQDRSVPHDLINYRRSMLEISPVSGGPSLRAQEEASRPPPSARGGRVRRCSGSLHGVYYRNTSAQSYRSRPVGISSGGAVHDIGQRKT
jgi:hypothetical protein